MTHGDFHAGCGSHVRISVRDLAGPHGLALSEIEHPATRKYPGIAVGSCDLAAGHRGLCEMYVETDQTEQGSIGHWIRWETVTYREPLPVPYEWVQSPDFCETKSAHGWWCSRPGGHEAGHSFRTEDL
ncbi:hypothetical protein [Nonomuraea wenchangensis]|uniref:hypothetical protein n=1 Tax=Nonomuraea wenchangensis TaxID=568860 RepID=UPI0011607C8E|nr:hypothetical protein [Nonomuraea wenchangensis]